LTTIKRRKTGYLGHIVIQNMNCYRELYKERSKEEKEWDVRNCLGNIRQWKRLFTIEELIHRTDTARSEEKKQNVIANIH